MRFKGEYIKIKKLKKNLTKIAIYSVNYLRSKMNHFEDELYKCFESRSNIVKLLNYRNYKFTDPKGDIEFDEFKNIYNDNEIVDVKKSMSDDLTIINNENESENCFIQWISDTKLNADKINELVLQISDVNTKTIIIISDYKPTPNAIDAVKLLKIVDNIKIDIWDFNQTQIFAPEHEYVPKHRICTNLEKTKLFNVYGDDIPKINLNDIMVKYLAAVKGNLIEIIRPSETVKNKSDCTYRIVV